jgi:hypothetical protein
VGNDLSKARSRVILLGASNLTRGMSTVIETARLMLGGPLDVFAALGHGRSFGMKSRVLVRSLPGILECELWEALEEPRHQGIEASRHQGASATFALITDIGNDIMYGASPTTITQWIEECAARLASHNARLIITPPPIASVRMLRPWKYQVVKAALFPMRRITFEQAMSRSHELHERIVDLALRLNSPAIALPGEWYGFDPIHIRRFIWPQAWWTILAPWMDTSATNMARAKPSLARWTHLRTRTPQQWWLLGLQRGRVQPSGQLPDGTRISLY